jgi:hypothetical protein
MVAKIKKERSGLESIEVLSTIVTQLKTEVRLLRELREQDKRRADLAEEKLRQIQQLLFRAGGE